MINVVYLVLVFGGSSANTASVLIPQANMAQCEVNAKNYNRKKDGVCNVYCIVGVMPK